MRTPTNFLAAIGSGDIHTSQIAGKILETEQKARLEQEREEGGLDVLVRPPLSATPSMDSGVRVEGVAGLLVNLARCCNPMPGEPIIGFITRGRGVSVAPSKLLQPQGVG